MLFALKLGIASGLAIRLAIPAKLIIFYDMEEIWKDIKGFEGLYQVSNIGIIKSMKKNTIRTLSKSHNGYFMVVLRNNGKQKGLRVSRVVATAFIDNPHNLPCVNHKDENKLNNNVDNLEWCTHKYNNNYGTVIERNSKKNRNNPITSKMISQYSKCGKFIANYPSIREANRVTGISRSGIGYAVKGGVLDKNGRFRSKNGMCGGYVWKTA